MFGRMNRNFAYQSQGGDWQGWTPPWLRDDDDERRGPRFGGHRGPFEWGHHGFGRRGPFGRGHHGFGRRGPFGPGSHFFEMRRRGPFGPGGPFGPEGPRGEGRRFFGRGDMKFALLGLLQERSMHGYEMMKALEEKSAGFYAPSAGSVYPTLQMLEDRGLVTSNESDGKKVYNITDAGRAALQERQGTADEFTGPPWRHGFGPGRHGSPELQALQSEAVEVARLLAIAGRMSFRDPEQLARLRGIIERARKDLSDMIYGASTKQD